MNNLSAMMTATTMANPRFTGGAALIGSILGAGDIAALGAILSKSGINLDGLSGATITSRGVTNMIKYWFSDSGYANLFSELDYDGDDLTEITVELRYDYAELNQTSVSPNHGALDTTAAREPTLPYKVPFGEVPERQD